MFVLFLLLSFSPSLLSFVAVVAVVGLFALFIDDLLMIFDDFLNEGRELARSMGCPFLEASAKARINIEESFFQLVREIRKWKIIQEGGTVPKSEGKTKTKKPICVIL
eukprot:TRINITY_DN3546_c0_g1_i1.p1 TRINITY_DN3546_c0_g1~~TRINITY_DN3546_c0_g1_i1.p1  ORF type:complete len:108 (-),score=38.46 TRINITY_DN3546_c0_g1_i1:130-453(-)